MTLQIDNVDVSTWTKTDGSHGYWLGVGFGTSEMSGADIVMCNFRYYGSTDDQFYCSDSFANYNSMPIPDETDNATDISTLATYDWTWNKASFVVTFDRPLEGDQVGTEDYLIINGANVPAIWAHGRIIGGVAQSHILNSDLDRDSFTLNLRYLSLSSVHYKALALLCLVFGCLLSSFAF